MFDSYRNRYKLNKDAHISGFGYGSDGKSGGYTLDSQHFTREAIRYADDMMNHRVISIVEQSYSLAQPNLLYSENKRYRRAA